MAHDDTSRTPLELSVPAIEKADENRPSPQDIDKSLPNLFDDYAQATHGRKPSEKDLPEIDPEETHEDLTRGVVRTLASHPAHFAQDTPYDDGDADEDEPVIKPHGAHFAVQDAFEEEPLDDGADLSNQELVENTGSEALNDDQFVEEPLAEEGALVDSFDNAPYVEHLAYDEVAAVHINRRFYVNDVPSPYLSKRQARENIETTRRRHTVITTFFVLLLVSGMVAAAGWYVWDTLKPEITREIPKFDTAKIERMEFVDSIDATSIVRPIDERTVSSEVSGTVVEIVAAEGAFVEEGDMLYRLENPTIEETLAKAQEALNYAQSEVDAKQANLDDAQKALDAARKRNSSTNRTNSSNSSNSTNSTSGSSETSTGTSTSTNSGTGTNSNSSTTDNSNGQQTTSGNDNSQPITIAHSTTGPVFHQAMASRKATGPILHMATETTGNDTTTNGTTTNGTSGSSGTSGNGNSTSSNNDTNSSSDSSSSSSTTNSKSTSITTLEARVKSAQKELDDAKKNYDPIKEMFDRAQAQYDCLVVRSPITGTLSDLNAHVQLSTGVVGSERLCTVSDLSAYLVQEEIPDDRAGQVYEGEEARLSFPAINDLFVTSYVVDVYDSEESGGCVANVIIENPDERIAKNMACNVSIVVQSIPNVLVVPLESLSTNDDGTTELNLLIDPTRGINTFVRVNVLGRNATQAAIEADNIQEGTTAVVSGPEPPQPAEEPDKEPAGPAEEPAPIE